MKRKDTTEQNSEGYGKQTKSDALLTQDVVVGLSGANDPGTQDVVMGLSEANDPVTQSDDFFALKDLYFPKILRNYEVNACDDLHALIDQESRTELLNVISVLKLVEIDPNHVNQIFDLKLIFPNIFKHYQYLGSTEWAEYVVSRYLKLRPSGKETDANAVMMQISAHGTIIDTNTNVREIVTIRGGISKFYKKFKNSLKERFVDERAFINDVENFITNKIDLATAVPPSFESTMTGESNNFPASHTIMTALFWECSRQRANSATIRQLARANCAERFAEWLLNQDGELRNHDVTFNSKDAHKSVDETKIEEYGKKLKYDPLWKRRTLTINDIDKALQMVGHPGETPYYYADYGLNIISPGETGLSDLPMLEEFNNFHTVDPPCNYVKLEENSRQKTAESFRKMALTHINKNVLNPLIQKIYEKDVCTYTDIILLCYFINKDIQWRLLDESCMEIIVDGIKKKSIVTIDELTILLEKLRNEDVGLTASAVVHTQDLEEEYVGGRAKTKRSRKPRHNKTRSKRRRTRQKRVKPGIRKRTLKNHK